MYCRFLPVKPAYLQVYLAECELGISIERMEIGGEGGATFDSFSKPITGSGLSKEEAISNALNSISSSDKKIVAFITSAKQKIDTYFKQHCKDVLKQAAQEPRFKTICTVNSTLFFRACKRPML